MSTEDLPQSAELASAYLDGELDGPERAAAETDPGIVAAVESFARVRAALGDVGPGDSIAKETAIAAALTEFDAMHTTGTSVTVNAATSIAAAAPTALAPVVPLQPRRHRLFTVITGAAAAAIVVVVAVAALNSNQGSDDLATSASEDPAIAAADSTPELKSLTADAGAATEAAPEASDSAAAGQADDAAPTVPDIGSPAALTDYAATVEVAATTAAPAGTAAPAATVAAASAAPAPSSYAAVPCLSSDQAVIGSIVYQGTPAVVVRNTATGALQAVADTDCRVLAEVPASQG
jgi:hypothetical protein